MRKRRKSDGTMHVAVSPELYSIPFGYDSASNEAIGAFLRLTAYLAKYTPEKSEVPISTMRVVCSGAPYASTLEAMERGGLVVVRGDIIELLGRGDFWQIKNTSEGRARCADLAAQALARDGGACRYCGSAESLTIDHIVPTSRGGRHRLENIATCCRSCNAAKGNRTPDEWQRGAVLPKGFAR